MEIKVRISNAWWDGRRTHEDKTFTSPIEFNHYREKLLEEYKQDDSCNVEENGVNFTVVWSSCSKLWFKVIAIN